MIEVWKMVEGFPSYQISNKGRVRSFQKNKERILKPTRKTSMSIIVNLYEKEKHISFRVGDMVLHHFLRSKKQGECCQHIDGDTDNNCIENLFWGMRSNATLCVARYNVKPDLKKWHPIPGFEGYFISRQAEVASILRNKIIILKPGKGGHGYFHFSLYAGNISFTKKLHYLMMITFIGPRPNGMFICHNNGIKTDNRLSNLRYDTQKSNELDAIKHGHKAKGSRHGKSILNEEQVIKIINDNNKTQMEMAIEYGVSRSTIAMIKCGSNWRHLREELNKILDK